jgi:predicted DNA-binding mobile mystery protein A
MKMRGKFLERSVQGVSMSFAKLEKGRGPGTRDLGNRGVREQGMESDDRAIEREKLDRELRFFRIAGKKASYDPQWLRKVRRALGVRVTDMARELGVNKSVIHRLEQSEEKKAISLNSMEKAAGAMDCKLVYAIVPRAGRTLLELAERRKWAKKLEKAASRE